LIPADTHTDIAVSCFPHLKIGGPALAYRHDWAEDFLAEMQKRQVPIDFLSWHIYHTQPQMVLWRAGEIKKMLIKYGYGDVETICNEWNFVANWREGFTQTIVDIGGVKGMGYTMSVICEAQKSNLIDMLMYYDTRPGAFCGAFDIITYRKLKPYYPLYWYGMFYDMEKEIPAENNIDNIYSLCGVDKDGKVLCVVTNYSENDEAPAKDIKLDFGKEGKYEIYLVDSEKDGELVSVTDKLEFTLPIHSFILVKEI
jgi:hypothetical protein